MMEFGLHSRLDSVEVTQEGDISTFRPRLVQMRSLNICLEGSALCLASMQR